MGSGLATVDSVLIFRGYCEFGVTSLLYVTNTPPDGGGGGHDGDPGGQVSVTNETPQPVGGREWRGLVWVCGLVMVVALAASPAMADSEVEATSNAGLPADDPDPDDSALMVLPLLGEHPLIDSWNDSPEGSERLHLGIDISAGRMTPLVAMTDSTVSVIRHSNEGAEGNMVILTDSAGWMYLYIHLNNDSPGTTDNSNQPEFAFAAGLEVGSAVGAGELIGYVGDSGNATGPHLHFAMKDPSGTYVNPYPVLVEIAGGGQSAAVLGTTETALAQTGSQAEGLGWIAVNLMVFGVAVELSALVISGIRRGRLPTPLTTRQPGNV